MTEPDTHSCGIVLANGHGLHARPATLLVEKAQEFEAEVFISSEGRKASCKSILDILSCGCPTGSKITVSATGSDSKEAVAAVSKFLQEL